MKNKARVLWQEITIWVMNVVIVILCILLLLVGANTIESMVSTFRPMYGENSFRYSVESNNFASLVSKYYTNVAEGEDSAKMQEYYGVAEYFEAASYYKAAVHTNDAEGMMHYRQKMDAAEQRMGELSFVSEIICEKLTIEE